MKKFFNVEKLGEGRIRISFIINLKLIGRLILLASITALAITGLYWLGVLLWTIKWWLLGIMGVAALAWMLKTSVPHLAKLNLRWLGLIAVLTGTILAIVFLCRSCEREEVVVEPETISEESFDEAFDWVVTSRAYLDGVQHGNTRAERALVGLKFVNGEPVGDMVFEGKTYEEAVDVIANDWRDLVVSSLNGVELTEQQLVAVTLFAMRNGKYGFLQSDFLKEVRSGNLDGAASTMALHYANGSQRSLKMEGIQYLWVLKHLWDGNISMRELVSWPMFSYKQLTLEQMYEGDEHIFTNEVRNVLTSGNFDTPFQALELNEM